jgi:hypothetical protein
MAAAKGGFPAVPASALPAGCEASILCRFPAGRFKKNTKKRRS